MMKLLDVDEWGLLFCADKGMYQVNMFCPSFIWSNPDNSLFILNIYINIYSKPIQ